MVHQGALQHKISGRCDKRIGPYNFISHLIQKEQLPTKVDLAN
jgi:hypothetical protein